MRNESQKREEVTGGTSPKLNLGIAFTMQDIWKK